MRVLHILLNLFVIVPLVVRGAAIEKPKNSIVKKEQSTKKDTESKIAVAQSKRADAITDVDADVGADAITDVDADVGADVSTDVGADVGVDFVSGEDVANFSGKSQKQVFNQIVPLANVKDFYDHHHPHNHHYWDYRHYFNHPRPHRHYDHDSHVHHYKYVPKHHSYHHEPLTYRHKSKHIYHESTYEPTKVHYHKHRYHIHKLTDHDYATKTYRHKDVTHSPARVRYYASPAHRHGAEGHHRHPGPIPHRHPGPIPHLHRVTTSPTIHQLVHEDEDYAHRGGGGGGGGGAIWEKWQPTNYGRGREYGRGNVAWLAKRHAAKKFDDGQYRPEHHFPKAKGGWKHRRANHDEDEYGELKSLDGTGSKTIREKEFADWSRRLAAAKAAAAKTAKAWREEDWRRSGDVWQKGTGIAGTAVAGGDRNNHLPTAGNDEWRDWLPEAAPSPSAAIPTGGNVAVGRGQERSRFGGRSPQGSPIAAPSGLREEEEEEEERWRRRSTPADADFYDADDAGKVDRNEVNIRNADYYFDDELTKGR